MVCLCVSLSVQCTWYKYEQDDSGVADAQYFEEWLSCTSVFSPGPASSHRLPNACAQNLEAQQENSLARSET